MAMRTDWAAVFDVDGTLTRQSTGALAEVVDRQALHPLGYQELRVLREYYMPFARRGELTHVMEMEWLRHTFRVYAERRLTRSDWQAAIDTVELRPGVVETLAWLVREGIPTAAISYGCADFVERLLSRHDIRLDAIYAGRLRHDGDMVIGADPSTYVIPTHKGERSRHFADAHDVPHDRLLAVGDSAGDRLLGHLPERRIMITDTEEQAEHVRRLNVACEVCVTNSFDPVRDFLVRRISSS